MVVYGKPAAHTAVHMEPELPEIKKGPGFLRKEGAGGARLKGKWAGVNRAGHSDKTTVIKTAISKQDCAKVGSKNSMLLEIIIFFSLTSRKQVI